MQGITADPLHLRQMVEQSIGLVMALDPRIGYAAASNVAKEALATGRGIAELVLEQGLLSAGELHRLLEPERLANVNR